MAESAMALPADHPMMKAWTGFQREQHAKGSMWLAFTKGMEALEAENAKLRKRLERAEGILRFADKLIRRSDIGLSAIPESVAAYFKEFNNA